MCSPGFIGSVIDLHGMGTSRVATKQVCGFVKPEDPPPFFFNFIYQINVLME